MRLKSYDLESLHAARDLIDKHYLRHMVIADIAREVGLSTTKLKSGFKELFGVGLYAYQVRRRMERARKLLQETNNPLRAIATATGYKSSSSFIVAFRSVYGLTPGQYRSQR